MQLNINPGDNEPIKKNADIQKNEDAAKHPHFSKLSLAKCP